MGQQQLLTGVAKNLSGEGYTVEARRTKIETESRVGRGPWEEPPPHQLGDLGERCKLSQRRSANAFLDALSPKRVLCHFCPVDLGFLGRAIAPSAPSLRL